MSIEQIKYHFYVIVNNKDIFEKNTKKSVNNLIAENEQVCFHITYNLNNEFLSIRLWINFILRSNYSNHETYKGSRLIFIHQDVFIYKNFINEIEHLLNNNCDKIGLFGFAGIDINRHHHKFMIDSGNFCFTEDIEPLIVDSVDEFLFGIDFDIFNKNNLFVSNIKGWHAYAAELSILLKINGYTTVMLPIFVEHNSIRVNNLGLTKTHQELFSIYGVSLNTLVGKISHKTLYDNLKIYLYSIYVNLFKWKFRSSYFERLKSFFLDDLNIRYNQNRVKQNWLKKFKEVYYIHIYESASDKYSYDIELEKTHIYFRIIKSVNDLTRYTDKNIIVSGITNKIEGFVFLKKCNLNIKKI